MYVILNDELYHHGIKGQKWGIRRYRNYDGSYTRAGLKRYYAAKEQYDKAHERAQRANKAYKENKTGDNKIERTNARIAEKKARNALNKHYKHLKQDKLADQGKELYSKGKTITSSDKVTKTLASISAVSASALAYNKNGDLLKQLNMSSKVSSKNLNKLLAATVVSTGGIAAVKGLKDRHEAKRLRAYYSHTSNY